MILIMNESSNRTGKAIEPNENIVAYMEHRELLRDALLVDCNVDILEKLMSNYIIVKQVLANLSWQDQLLNKTVCQMWRDIVITLQKERLIPYDFVCVQSEKSKPVLYVKSHDYSVEPLAVFIFLNDSAIVDLFECKNISPSPCSVGCKESHNLLDMTYHSVCFPKKCMLAIKCQHLVYVPVRESKTYKHMMRSANLDKPLPFLCGLYIPKIPNVKLDFFNVLSKQSQVLQDFFSSVSKVCESRYVKAVLVFVTDKFLLSTENDVMFLNYFKETQKDVPFALGGCLIDDTLRDPKDLLQLLNYDSEDRPFLTDDTVSIAVFSVPKDVSQEENGLKNSFEAYSLVVEASDWSKIRIQKTINEFAEKVPRFEHSAALKLSCVGRDLRHEVEQDIFRAAFPDTPIAGCYGNGEIGHNHPPRFDPPNSNDIAKRYKKDPSLQGILYSYSTVFVYFGWGRMIPK